MHGRSRWNVLLSGLYGPVRSGSVGPKKPKTGRRSAAAAWIGPESLLMTTSAWRSSSIISPSVVRPHRRNSGKSAGSAAAIASSVGHSPAEPVVAKYRSGLRRRNASLTRAKSSGGNCLLAQRAPGISMASGFGSGPHFFSSEAAFAGCSGSSGSSTAQGSRKSAPTRLTYRSTACPGGTGRAVR